MPKGRAPARAPNRNNQTSTSSPFNMTTSRSDARRAAEPPDALARLLGGAGGRSGSRTEAQTILPEGDGSDANLKGGVEAGSIDVFRAFLATSANMLGSPEVVEAMPGYMRIKYDQISLVLGAMASRVLELIPSGVPWAINATTQIRRAGHDFVRGLQFVPSIHFSQPNFLGNENHFSSGIHVAFLIAAEGLPGPEMSTETAEENLRLLTAVWRPTEMTGREALKDEKIYRKACSAFRRCMLVLSDEGPVHLPNITGVHWEGLVQRFVQDIKRPGTSFLSRLSALMLLCEMYRWNHELQEENGGLILALSRQKVIASLSDLLIEYKENRQSNEIRQLDSKSIDEVTLELPTFWCAMMLGGELMEIDDLGVQTVGTELLNTVDIWRLESSVDRSKLMQQATTSLFVALAAHGDASLYVKPAVQLIDARQRMETLPGANPSIIQGMVEYEKELAEGFDEVQKLQINNRSSTSERARTCAAKDCERGWDPQGGPLKACSGCRTVEYCSPTCQKAHWSAHKAACRAASKR